MSYAGWTADITMTAEISDILATSRGASKRREKRIDKVILDYYDKNEIKFIKRIWRESDLEPHIKRILGQALEAHLRGEYALCISFLPRAGRRVCGSHYGATEGIERYAHRRFRLGELP